MKLNKSTDFSLRILIALARENRKFTNSELSSRLNIPNAYLVKLVRELSRRNYIRTRKGKGGGVCPLADPKKITLLEIIELVEGPLSFSDCLIDSKYCTIEPNCKLKKKMAALERENKKLLSKTFIADLI